MEPVLLLAALVCSAANIAVVIADLVPARFVLANSAELGLKPTSCLVSPR